MEVYPLAEYILAESLPDPDFVKIDVEGYEYDEPGFCGNQRQRAL